MKRFTSLVLAAALALSCAACSSGSSESTPSAEPEATAAFKAGTYTATVEGNNGPLTVSVTVSNDAITAVDIGENVETKHLMDSVGVMLPQAILDQQSLAVDAVSGATITSRAILSAVTKCIEQAGGDVAALSVKPEPGPRTSETIDCDVAVVGAGIAGLTAANRLLSEGVNVVLLEQLDIAGGTARFAGGSMYGTLGDIEENTPEALLNKFLAPNVNVEKATRLFETMDQTFDFYKSLGFTLGYEKPEETTRVVVVDQSIGEVLEEGGYIWSKSLENAFADRGGELRLGTKVVALKTENGAVVGVEAETDNGTLTVNAKYTIMASGSAVGNKELLSIYCPTRADGEVFQSSSGCTGEGIAMMLDLGAVPLDNWNPGLTLPCTVAAYARTTREYLSPLANAGALFVNYDAVREAKETTGKIFSTAWQTVGKVDAFFAVYDAPLAESLGFTELLETGVSENSRAFWKADTLEEVAELAGLDKDTFLATVEEYNGYCAAGEDAAFGKAPELLTAIDEGPFYIVKHELANLDVVGGVLTSNSFEVLNGDGEPIPGLYAAGSTTAGDLVGNGGGANFTVAAYSARTAAESIIENLK